MAGVAAALFVGAGVASAEHRQPGPTLTLDPATVAAGASVVATLRTTCVDGASIEVGIEPAGDVTAAICSNNSCVARLTAPSRPGAYDVNADGVGLLARATLTVTAALGGPEQPFAEHRS
ncbi:MAG: hypothetical protein ACR2HQ_10280 [Ilumatobacteraceae bacterium]